MNVTLKILKSGKWVESQVDVLECEAYKGQDAVALIADGYVWVGNQKWYDHYAAKGYIVTNTTALMDVIDYARQIFFENREERLAICEADNVPQETIQEIFNQYPLVYGKEPT